MKKRITKEDNNTLDNVEKPLWKDIDGKPVLPMNHKKICANATWDYIIVYFDLKKSPEVFNISKPKNK
jgi:hypothetical protein